VLADCDGKDSWSLSQKWNCECMTDGESGDEKWRMNWKEWHHQEYDWYKADKIRQEVFSKQDVMHSEISDEWFLHRKCPWSQRVTTGKERVLLKEICTTNRILCDIAWATAELSQRCWKYTNQSVTTKQICTAF